ncbi:hypothetical protein QTO34_001000 [Cnephaeus nilssonii]|uniref:Uncharacterized protein n=1 Tax=Cnephaeus nilssonii TaxID=3371016 RepID=A0AA40HV25_CNENI|nr:hypothetical protein QTO34_001000 [Eptesicus nilssonii]
MEDYQSAEETTFVVDEVSNIVKEAIESAIGGNCLSAQQSQPVDHKCSRTDFKPTHQAGKTIQIHCDLSTDGSCTVRWENKTMYCIVSAFGLSI